MGVAIGLPLEKINEYVVENWLALPTDVASDEEKEVLEMERLERQAAGGGVGRGGGGGGGGGAMNRRVFDEEGQQTGGEGVVAVSGSKLDKTKQLRMKMKPVLNNQSGAYVPNADDSRVHPLGENGLFSQEEDRIVPRGGNEGGEGGLYL